MKPQEEKATVATESAREIGVVEVEGQRENEGNCGQEDGGRRRASKLWSRG